MAVSALISRPRWLAAALMGLVSAPIFAQGSWDWTVTPYLWATGIDGNAALGPARADLDVGFDDIVDVLDGAALVHVEARRGRTILFGDVVYLSTAPDDRVDFDATIVEAGYFRRLSGAQLGSGMEVGLRYWDFELGFQPNRLQPATGSRDWIDGFIGVRNERQLNDRWHYVLRANVGAGGSDFSVGADINFHYELPSTNRIVVGLKLLDVDYVDLDPRRFAIDSTMLGLSIGYLFD